MENITITFLGTGNAMPTKRRNHPSIHIAFADQNILVDCGEGTQRQFHSTELKATKLTHLLITHWHGDHILGLPGLFQSMALNDYQKTLNIAGPYNIKSKIEMLQQLHRDIKINYSITEAKNTFIDNNKFSITAHEMQHGTPTLAYTIQLKDQIRIDKEKLKKLKIPQGPHMKQLQQGKDITINNKKFKAKDLTYTDKGKKVTIILDTKKNNEAIKAAKDTDLVIAEATFSKDENLQAEQYKHLTAEQAATIAKKAKAKALILTHISQRYEHKLDKIEQEAKAIFKNTKIVKDFDQIII